MPHMYVEPRHVQNGPKGLKTPGPFLYGRTYFTSRGVLEEPEMGTPTISSRVKRCLTSSLWITPYISFSRPSFLPTQQERNPLLALEFLRRCSGRFSTRHGFHETERFPSGAFSVLRFVHVLLLFLIWCFAIARRCLLTVNSLHLHISLIC